MSCENCEESAYVIDALAKLLAEIAIVVNGPEPPLTRWSYHDLPEKVRALKQAPPAAVVPESYESPVIGDYVLGTKYSDGDPGDPWAVGIYAGMKNGRHVVTHHDGKPIYAKGFSRVEKITCEQGRGMLKVSRELESAGGSLWAILAAAQGVGRE